MSTKRKIDAVENIETNPSKVLKKEEIIVVELSLEDKEMQRLGLPLNFNSTKGKPVDTNKFAYGVNVQKKRNHAQYMHSMRKPVKSSETNK
jgi:hypothetical protein